MPKKILIISSSTDYCPTLNSLVDELTKANHVFALKTVQTKTSLQTYFSQKHLVTTTAYLGPKINQGFFKAGLFLLSFPVLFLIALFQLGQDKYKQKLDLLICLAWPEKLIFTPAAKLLKIKTLWLELPGEDYASQSFLKIYKLFSRFTNIIVFNSLTKTNLIKLNIDPNKIKIIQPGIPLNQHNYQANIFDKLAQSEQAQKKFFSVGTVVDLNHQQKIESLFQAIKKCLTVVPNIQLIIIGEGKERKNLSWLAKKMEIENLVWFVGEQAYLRKWLESLDLYVVATEKNKLADLMVALNAMSAELPILADYQSGLADLIFENQSGTLLKIDNSEELAQEIIRLAQDKRIRAQLGTAGKERVEKYFSLSKMVEQFEKLL